MTTLRKGEHQHLRKNLTGIGKRYRLLSVLDIIRMGMLPVLRTLQAQSYVIGKLYFFDWSSYELSG